MKKFCFGSVIISAICLLFLCPFVGNLQVKNDTPAYSKEYIEYLETEDKSIYGDVIPELYTFPTRDEQKSGSFSSYYCLRDEYKIYTTYQDGYGLCWAYSCTTALETMIAKNFNEFYSFSAAWVGLTTKYYWDNHGYTTYELGGGGNMSYFDLAVNEYGLMLQSDFDLKDFLSVDDKNYMEAYNLYKDEVIDSLGFDFEAVAYYNPSVDTIKNHIMQNGSLYAAIYSPDIVNETSLCTLVGSQSDHAISIIGWDDSYKASGWNNQGAWIALNSWGDDWGNNGIFYISYDDVHANEEMFGFVPADTSDDDIYVSIASSNSETDNLIVNKYSSTKNTTASNFEKQYNIFEEGDDISLEFGYATNKKIDNIQINVFKDGKTVNNRFSNISYDLTNKKINIDSNANDTALLSLDENEVLSAGTYEVEISFISEGSTTIVTKTIVVFDGLELDSLMFYSDATADFYTTKQVRFFTSSYNSFNQEEFYYQIYAKEHCYIYFFASTYSKIINYSYTSNSGLSIGKSVANFTPYGVGYSNGYLYFAVHLTSSNSRTATATFTLVGESGKSETYNFLIYNTKYFTNSFQRTYVNVDYNGADGNKSVAGSLAITSGEKNYLPTPEKTNSVFVGWYTSPSLSEESKLPTDAIGTYLTLIHITNNTGNNCYINNCYELKNGGVAVGFSYIYLYAKWDTLKYSITYSWINTSGVVESEEVQIDAHSNTNIAIKDISTVAEEGYEFVWESGYTDINFDIGIINSLNQNIRITGKYIPKTPVVHSLTIDNEQKSSLSATYTQNTNYKLAVAVSHGANNVDFSYTWKKKDAKGIFRKVAGAETATLDVFKASHSGEYICEVVATNHALSVNSKVATSTVFTITINKAQTVIDTSKMITEYNYDGIIHEVKGAIINHSELSNDDIEYKNNIIKDVGTGTQMISIISKATENYTEAVVEVPIKINKAKITIKIDNKRGAVFAEKQPFTYVVKHGKVFENDNLNLQYISSANIYFAGQYKISAVSKNTNYDVEVIDGTYTIYIEGLSLVLLISGIVIFLSLAVLFAYYMIRKKSIEKHLYANDFDEDIRF